MLQLSVGKHLLGVERGDITQKKVDAIVNAANVHLKLGEGVAGAILKKGGQIIQQQCDAIGDIKTGESVLTFAGDLPCKFVIHTVGPRYGNRSKTESAKMLRKSVKSALQFLSVNNIQTMALPAISTGVYKFPKKKCANIMLSTIYNELKKKKMQQTLKSYQITVVVYDQESIDAFEQVFAKLQQKITS